ncbi:MULTISPECIES: phosphopantetheine-binding protein [Streptomyces]|uniref:Isochorismatase n=2 Tax=Streptomyces TaxID=1883 RepID=A0A0W7X592_9ACTN|nr:phosphopantetheine-binding protein [Streptomyces silvensis]KUF18031.1 isochorismatase [Streptomyces silvensis]MVO85571.1 isochorismatase [Streptomyces typhae]
MSATLTLDQLRKDIADVLGEEPGDIPLDENLIDYGLDSVRLMTLVGRWRETYGVEVALTDLAERPAVDAWAALLGLTA